MGYDSRILNDRIMHSRIQYPELEKTPQGSINPNMTLVLDLIFICLTIRDQRLTEFRLG